MMGTGRTRRAFTLVELVVSMTIMTILVAGITSAILMASRVLPDPGSQSRALANAADAVERISGDLLLATTLLRAEDDIVRFEVPDRGHGSAGPERMNYSWSGTPGDPLTHRYNASPPATVCEDVHDFSLEYVWEGTPPSGVIRVLLVVDDTASLNAAESYRKATIESWGFTVQLIGLSEPQSSFDTAVAACDLAYIVASSTGDNLGAKLTATTIGVVTEYGGGYDDLGLAATDADMWVKNINVVDDTHELTAGFGTGVLNIFPDWEECYEAANPLAGGGRVLAEVQGGSLPLLMVIEPGGALYGGGFAKGRRVKLPWGKDAVDYASMTADGLELMKRSIQWAAANPKLVAVRLTVQVGAETSGRVEMLLQLLNTPEMQ